MKVAFFGKINKQQQQFFVEFFHGEIPLTLTLNA